MDSTKFIIYSYVFHSNKFTYIIIQAKMKGTYVFVDRYENRKKRTAYYELGQKGSL